MSEIVQFNNAFLCMAQRMLRADRLAALHQLGINEETAKLIENLSAVDIMRLSESPNLICTVKNAGDAFLVMVQAAKGDLNAHAHSTLMAAKRIGGRF